MAVCAPHALESACIRIEHNDAPVSVSVSNKDFIRLRIHAYVGRFVHIDSVRISFALAAVSNLHDELTRIRHFDNLMVIRPVATYPNIPLVVHSDAMLAFGPFIALTRATPSLNEVPVRIKFQHGWRCMRFVLCRSGGMSVDIPWSLQHPHVVMRINENRGYFAKDPLVWYIRPGGIHLESRHLTRVHLLSLKSCVSATDRRGLHDYDDKY